MGSGIFTLPPKILIGTGSVAGALFTWSFCGVISICGAYCWLELGLTLPIRYICEDGRIIRVSTPRSGGEKNILEYIFKKPAFFITCLYGIMFVILGNISGNAIIFAIYILIAAGNDPIGPASHSSQKGPIIGIAICLLTFCAALHTFSRRGGVILGNIVATIKVLVLLALAILGMVHAGRKFLQSAPGSINESAIPNAPENITSHLINNASSINLNPHNSFAGSRHDLGSFVDSSLFVIFTYTGFEQPFYVLSEVKRPRTILPKYTILAMVLTTFLYIFVNIAYMCVVPKEAYITNPPANAIDMASTFLHYLFDSTMGHHTAKRVMAGLICISIFGNLVVITFTAARVKQEIAKEGILPFSLFFATSHITPWAWLQSRFWPNEHARPATTRRGVDLDDDREKSPSPALLLHGLSSILLVAVTSMLSPVTAYSFLTTLYAYVNGIIIGVLVSGGLLYLKLDSWLRGKHGRNWADKVAYLPWLNPLHAFIYFAAVCFFMFTAFVPPTAGSPYEKHIQGYPWWVLPTVGLSSLLWGVVWYGGLKAILWKRRETLQVTRTPYIERDQDGHHIQTAELVEHERLREIEVFQRDVESDMKANVYEMT
jgi:amino acid transporter